MVESPGVPASAESTPAHRLGEAAAGDFLTAMLAAHSTLSPLETIALVRGAAASVAGGLHDAVERARSARHTWAEIGQVLGTTRQAAFQRFGRPVDTRTGRPLAETVLPGAGDRAVTLFTQLSQGHWRDARRDFDERVGQRLDEDRLAGVWASISGRVGALERLGTPAVYPAGEHTVVDVPLFFEAGDRIGRVSLDRRGRVAGLFFLPPSLAES